MVCKAGSFDSKIRASMETAEITGKTAEISECTAELCATAEQLRTIVEHAPEAIAVFDCHWGRFVLCNENATRLFGLSRQQLLRTDVLAISVEFQGDGQPSSRLVRERI